MGRRIDVRVVRKEEPDIRLYALALIALARRLQEEESRRPDHRQPPEVSARTEEEVARERS